MISNIHLSHFFSRCYFLRHQRICFAHNFGTAWKVRKVWHTIKVFQFPIGHNIEGIWQQLARCGLLVQVLAPIVGNHGLHSLHTVQSGWIQEYFFTSLWIGFKNGCIHFMVYTHYFPNFGISKMFLCFQILLENGLC